MTLTRETIDLERDDPVALPVPNIKLARYIGGALEPVDSRDHQLIAADELVTGSDFP